MSQEITVIVKWWWWWVRRTLERQAHGSRRGSRLETFCVQLQMGVLQSRTLSASLKTLRVPADASRAMLVCNLMRQSRARVREIHHGWKFYGPRDKIKCSWSRDYWRNWRTSVLNTISCFSFFYVLLFGFYGKAHSSWTTNLLHESDCSALCSSEKFSYQFGTEFFPSTATFQALVWAWPSYVRIQVAR